MQSSAQLPQPYRLFQTSVSSSMKWEQSIKHGCLIRVLRIKPDTGCKAPNLMERPWKCWGEILLGPCQASRPSGHKSPGSGPWLPQPTMWLPRSVFPLARGEGPASCPFCRVLLVGSALPSSCPHSCWLSAGATHQGWAQSPHRVPG